MRSNKRNDLKSCYIVSDGRYCMEQKVVTEKAVKSQLAKILGAIKIKGQILTIDTMGT